MDNELHIAVDQVVDMKSLLEFIGKLKDNWNESIKREKESPSDPYCPMGEWENTGIGTFLDASAAWAESINADSKYANKYCIFAHMLLAGQFYE